MILYIYIDIPSGKHTKSYGIDGTFILDLPIEHDDFP